MKVDLAIINAQVFNTFIKKFEKNNVFIIDDKFYYITDDEIERAINAIAVSCVGGLRYGGTNEKILKRLYEMGAGDQCDHKPSDIQQPLTTQSQSASKQQSHSYLHVFLRDYLIRSIIIIMIIIILVYFCSIL